MITPIEKNRVSSPKKPPEEGGQINKDSEESNKDTQDELKKQIEKLKAGSEKLSEKLKIIADKTRSENTSPKSEKTSDKSAGEVPPSVQPESRSPIPPKIPPAETVSKPPELKNTQQPKPPVTPATPSPSVSQTQSPKAAKSETLETDVSEISKVKPEQVVIPETPKMDKLSDQEMRTINSETVKPSETTTKKFKINGIDGAIFEGESYHNGLPKKGKVIFNNGTIYEGTLNESGFLDGSGVVRRKDGSTVSGVWKNGKCFEGTGKDQDDIVTQKYHYGQDVYSDYQGGKYRGKLDNRGQPVDQGSVVYPNGDRFMGSFSAGKRNGFGKLLRKDGTQFEGEYRNGSRLKGVEKKADGTRYTGGYDENGLWSGDAEEVTPDGNVKKGVYKEGKLVTGEVINKDRIVVERYRDGQSMVTDAQKDQVKELIKSARIQTSPELEKSLHTLDTEVSMSPERLRGIQGDIAQKIAQSKTGVVDPSKASDTEWSDFLTQRNEARKQMGLEPYPIILLDDFKTSKPKNYLDHLARLEFVIRNTDSGKKLGAIVDKDHYFMSPELQAELDSLRPRDGGSVVTSRREGNQNILTLKQGDREEQWNINEPGWMYESGGTVPIYAKDHTLFFHKKGEDGEEISFTIPASKAFRGTGWNEEAVQRYSEKAYQDNLAEKNNREKIAGFDLPKDRPVGFISVDAPRDNATRSSSEGFSEFFPDVMRGQGYDIRTTPKTNFIGGNGVHSNIQSSINTQRKNGVKDIYLQLNGHGNPEDGLFFNNKDWYDSRGRLTKSQFSDLLKNNPDMHFTINTIACHNAGLTKVMKQLPKAIQDRVTFFAGTKEDVVNYSSGVNDENTLYTHPSTRSHDSDEFRENNEYSRGTIYEQYLGYYLSQGKTYGEAHWLADKKTQENSNLNPEAVYRGDLYVSNEQKENPNFS